jgi:hypothetical protein
MKRMIGVLLAAMLLLGKLQAQQVSIIPQPAKLEVLSGYFLINETVSLQYNEPALLKPAADWFRAAIADISGIRLSAQPNAARRIVLQLATPVQPKDESYTLDVSANLITIKAKSYGGIF